MAIVNDIEIGTASVANGSTSVTGTGTPWEAVSIQPGDLFERAGLWVPIASVESDTELTLAEVWPGATLTDSAYRVRLQPDGSRYQAAARALVEMLSDGKLASLADQDGAANKLPYLNGSTTFGLADFTAWARSLLDDGDVNAFWATVGATSPASAAFRRGNLLGAVSQASGVPTGAMVQRGSNANGEYVRFADGTQICSSEKTGSSSADVTWTFPAVFAAAPLGIVSTTWVGAGGSGTAILSVIWRDVQTAYASFYISSTSNVRLPALCKNLAFGRWF